MELHSNLYGSYYVPERRYRPATPPSPSCTISTRHATSLLSLGSTVESVGELPAALSRPAHNAPSETLAALELPLHSTASTQTSSLISYLDENPSSRATYASSLAPPQSAASLVLPGSVSQSAGWRVQTALPRGVYNSPGEGGVHWQLAIETIIQYRFTNADLLEEALEAPDSGVMCVGEGRRQLGRDGNEGLAGVGVRAAELVLGEEGYAMKIVEAEISRRVSRALGRKNLDRLGRASKMEHFMRRRRGDFADKKGLWNQLKEDVKGEDPSRTVARAVRAILGAVYFDGGLAELRRVMKGLNLTMEGK